MQALHLVYKHWFITVLMLRLGLTPVVRNLLEAVITAASNALKKKTGK